MTEYKMRITDDAAASMAASIVDRQKLQVARVRQVMRDMTVLEESHRHGTVTSRDTVQALEDMYEVLQDVAFVLSKEAS